MGPRRGQGTALWGAQNIGLSSTWQGQCHLPQVVELLQVMSQLRPQLQLVAGVEPGAQVACPVLPLWDKDGRAQLTAQARGR